MVGTKRRHDRGRLRIRVGLWSRAGHMTLLRIRVLAAAAAVGSLRALVRELRAPVRELRALVRETTLARILTLMGLTGPLARATGPEIGLVRIALSQHRGGLIRRLPIAPRLGRFVARLPATVAGADSPATVAGADASSSGSSSAGKRSAADSASAS